MNIFFNVTFGEKAARLLGLFAFIMTDGIARHIGVNLAISGIVGVCFFVPYHRLGTICFGNATSFRTLLRD